MKSNKVLILIVAALLALGVFLSSGRTTVHADGWDRVPQFVNSIVCRTCGE